MYKKSEKKRLNLAIEMYLSDEIDGSTFVHDFHLTHNLNLSSLKLNDKEYKAFYELSVFVGRLSESDSKNAMVICPMCKKVMQNPRFAGIAQ